MKSEVTQWTFWCGSAAEMSTSAWFFISSMLFLYIMPYFAETLQVSAEKEQVTDSPKNNLSFCWVTFQLYQSHGHPSS